MRSMLVLFGLAFLLSVLLWYADLWVARIAKLGKVPPGPTCLLYGTDTFVSYAPNCEERVTNGTKVAVFRYNGMGIRELPARAGRGRALRVLLLGDCFIENRAFPVSESLEKRVQERLAEQGIRAHVYNAGQGSTSILRDRLRLELLLKELKIDAVIYAYGGGTGPNTTIHKKYLVEADGRKRLEIKNPLHLIFGEKIFMEFFATTALPRLAHHLWYFSHFLRLRFFVPVEEIVEDQKQELENLRGLTESHGARFRAFLLVTKFRKPPEGLALANSYFFAASGMRVTVERQLELLAPYFERYGHRVIRLLKENDSGFIGLTERKEVEAFSELVAQEILKSSGSVYSR